MVNYILRMMMSMKQIWKFTLILSYMKSIGSVSWYKIIAQSISNTILLVIVLETQRQTLRSEWGQKTGISCGCPFMDDPLLYPLWGSKMFIANPICKHHINMFKENLHIVWYTLWLIKQVHFMKWNSPTTLSDDCGKSRSSSFMYFS